MSTIFDEGMEFARPKPRTATEHAQNIERNLTIRDGQKKASLAGGVVTTAATALSMGALTALYHGKIASNATFDQFAKGLWNAAKNNKGATVAILAASTALGAISVLSNARTYQMMNEQEVGRSTIALRRMAAQGDPKAQEVFGKWSRKAVAEKEASGNLER